jgi:hypothetical protein
MDRNKVDAAKAAINLATQAGRAQDASEFKKPEQQQALKELVAEGNKKVSANPPRGAFDDAEAEARRRQYIGSAIDKAQGKSPQAQTGTPATHTEGNF